MIVCCVVYDVIMHGVYLACFWLVVCDCESLRDRLNQGCSTAAPGLHCGPLNVLMRPTIDSLNL